jgi:SAM-dependent methyltransferase
MTGPPPSVARWARSSIDALPDPARRRVRAWLGRPGPRRVTLDGLDAELSTAAGLFASSEDDARAFVQGFELEPPGSRPADPFSEEYRAWAWELYHRISARPGYSVANESSPFDLDRAITCPFPFETGSARVVGGDLVARGHLLQCLGERTIERSPPARIVEFGPGWGNLTGDLTSTGFEVTAVEVDSQFCTLVERRCPHPERLTVVRGDMLDFRPSQPVDAAVFFESFHHCSDHMAMLDRLHHVVRPGGAVFFASEPISRLPYPWGPRLDGLSVWSSRTYGWLELGFDADYFDAALARTGWVAERRTLGPSMGTTDVIVATPDPNWRL